MYKGKIMRQTPDSTSLVMSCPLHVAMSSALIRTDALTPPPIRNRVTATSNGARVSHFIQSFGRSVCSAFHREKLWDPMRVYITAHTSNCVTVS